MPEKIGERTSQDRHGYLRSQDLRRRCFDGRFGGSATLQNLFLPTDCGGRVPSGRRHNQWEKGDRVLTDQELMAVQIRALFTHDARSRLLCINEPDGGGSAPRMFLG